MRVERANPHWTLTEPPLNPLWTPSEPITLTGAKRELNRPRFNIYDDKFNHKIPKMLCSHPYKILFWLSNVGNLGFVGITEKWKRPK